MRTALLTALSVAFGLSTAGVAMPKPPPMRAAETVPVARGAAVVDVSVRPTLAFEPATALIVATVERQSENRGLRVAVTSDTYSRSSYRQLDGEYEARTHAFRVDNLPAGLYTVTVSVYGPGGRLRAVDTGVIDVRP